MPEPTRWYVTAYRCTNGSVGTLGMPTVIRKDAEAETEQYRTIDARVNGGNVIFTATRLEYPWEEVDA